MTREQKLALIVGFALVLVVGVLISDQLSAARRSVDPASSTAGTLNVALEPSGETDLAFGREFQKPEPVITRPRQDDTVLVLKDPSTEPEPTTTLADNASDALRRLQDGAEAVGDLMRDAQNEAKPAIGYADAPGIDMGQEYKSPTPPVEAKLGGDADPTVQTPVQAPVETASDKTEQPSDVRPVRTHRVAEDETLWSIAKKYYGDGGLAPALANYNATRIGKGNVIHVGSSLLIPDAEALGGTSKSTKTASTKSKGDDDQKVASATPVKKTADKPAKKAEPAKKSTTTTTVPKTYTVKSGDTLQKISDKFYGTTKRWDDILEANNGMIDDEDGLEVGMVIKLPR